MKSNRNMIQDTRRNLVKKTGIRRRRIIQNTDTILIRLKLFGSGSCDETREDAITNLSSRQHHPIQQLRVASAPRFGKSAPCFLHVFPWFSVSHSRVPRTQTHQKLHYSILYTHTHSSMPRAKDTKENEKMNRIPSEETTNF